MTIRLELRVLGRWNSVVIVAAILATTAGCHQTLATGGKCGVREVDASTNLSESSAGAVSNDPGCPASWSDVIPGGYPAICTASGLICTYPEGQAECAPDGTVLKWATLEATPGCGEKAPAVGAACGAAGLSCQYVTGAPDENFTTNYCCDGTRCAWTLQGDGGCSNGNTCGTISTSDYDQSCTVDSDCVLEPAGDFCQRNTCTSCVGGAVSTKAQAQYEADLASKISAPALCPCPSSQPAVCDHGKCAVGTSAPPAAASGAN